MPSSRWLPLLMIAAFLLSASPVHAADDSPYFKLAELLRSDAVRESLDETGVTLYWASRPAPPMAETARPDTDSRTSISLSPFGGSARHCIDAFERALGAMTADARRHGFDAVVDLHVVRDDQPLDDGVGFHCKPGYKTTEVTLRGTLAMTTAAFDRARSAEAASPPARAAAEGVVVLPLAAILGSPEVAALLGPKLRLHAGPGDPPAYATRFGPDDYSQEGDVRKLGVEGACTRAAVDALGDALQEAREHGYDSIIRVRSHLDRQFAAGAGDLECRVDKKSATVTLQASLATLE